ANDRNVWLESATGYSETTPGAVFDGNEVRWHFDNLEPTEEDNIEISLVTPRLWQSVLNESQTVVANPSDGEAWGRLGKAYKATIRMPKGYLRDDPAGREIYELSRQAYEKCLALLPEDSLWHAGYADLLWPHYYFDIHFGGAPDETGLLSRILLELQTALELDPNNQVANQLLDEISYSMPDAVVKSESGYELLALTATIVPLTPYRTETPTSAPTAVAQPSIEALPTALPPATSSPGPTSAPTRPNASPLCGSAALMLPALGIALLLSHRKKT
ncbi:MAG TPA: hypothetical protein VH744_11180, partial [Terriglobales bacterium]